MLGLYQEQCQGGGLAFCEIKEIVRSVLEPERGDLGKVSMARTPRKTSFVSRTIFHDRAISKSNFEQMLNKFESRLVDLEPVMVQLAAFFLWFN